LYKDKRLSLGKDEERKRSLVRRLFLSNKIYIIEARLKNPRNRQPIINSPPHLTSHPKGVHGNEQFWLEERRKSVRGSTKIAWIYKSSARVNETKSCER